MKIRSGFVSNSSTSSFVVYGYVMETEEIFKVFGGDENEESPSEVLDRSGIEYHKEEYGNLFLVGPCILRGDNYAEIDTDKFMEKIEKANEIISKIAIDRKPKIILEVIEDN